MLIDTSHQLNDGYSMVITVDKQADSMDFAMMCMLAREDIVVTQDFGLAAMVLGKGARAVSQNGLVYTDDNIDKRRVISMYLTQTLNLNEKQFLRLCDEKGISKSFSKHALCHIFRELDDVYTMSDEELYLEATSSFEKWMAAYKEYTFEQLSEHYGHLVDPEWRSKPFYQYHTTLLMAMNETDDFELVCFYDNPEQGGADTYLVFFQRAGKNGEAQYQENA